MRIGQEIQALPRPLCLAQSALVAALLSAKSRSGRRRRLEPQARHRQAYWWCSPVLFPTRCSPVAAAVSIPAWPRLLSPACCRWAEVSVFALRFEAGGGDCAVVALGLALDSAVCSLRFEPNRFAKNPFIPPESAADATCTCAGLDSAEARTHAARWFGLRRRVYMGGNGA